MLRARDFEVVGIPKAGHDPHFVVDRDARLVELAFQEQTQAAGRDRLELPQLPPQNSAHRALPGVGELTRAIKGEAQSSRAMQGGLPRRHQLVRPV